MKTKIKTYTRNNETIILVGVAHIGTEKYYKEIQRALNYHNPKNVLYEGVRMKNPKLMELYNLIADICNLKMQKNIIKYNDNWTRSDLDYELLRVANGGELDFEKAINSMDEKSIELMKKFKGIFKAVLLFVFKYILPLTAIKKDDPVILTLRNSKVIIDMFEVLKNSNVVCLFYGDRHSRGIEKYIKKVGFKLYGIDKLNALQK